MDYSFGLLMHVVHYLSINTSTNTNSILHIIPPLHISEVPTLHDQGAGGSHAIGVSMYGKKLGSDYGRMGGSMTL